MNECPLVKQDGNLNLKWGIILNPTIFPLHVPFNDVEVILSARAPEYIVENNSSLS